MKQDELFSHLFLSIGIKRNEIYFAISSDNVGNDLRWNL